MGGTQSPWRFVKPGHILNNMQLDFYDQAFGMRGFASDFLVWDGPVAEGSSGGIILSGVTGDATITRPAIKNVGSIRLNNSAAAGANGQVEIPGQWGYVVGKRLWFFVRFAMSDPDDLLVFLGLGTPGNTDFIAGLPAEGIFFEKAETDTDFGFHVRDNGTSTEDTALGATFATADTYYNLAFRVNASGTIDYWYGTDIDNMTLVATLSAATANLPDDAGDELSLYFGVETGNSEADYIELDQLLCVQER